MAAKKQYTKFAAPGYSSRYEYHIPKDEYNDYYLQHIEELADMVRQLGFKVTPSREKAAARMKVNKAHNYPHVSHWNMYVKENIHRVMAEQNVPAKDALHYLGKEYKALYPKQPKQVAAGISGGARRPRRRAPLLRM